MTEIRQPLLCAAVALLACTCLAWAVLWSRHDPYDDR